MHTCPLLLAWLMRLETLKKKAHAPIDDVYLVEFLMVPTNRAFNGSTTFFLKKKKKMVIQNSYSAKSSKEKRPKIAKYKIGNSVNM